MIFCGACRDGAACTEAGECLGQLRKPKGSDPLDKLHQQSKLTKESVIAFLQLCDVIIDSVKEMGPQGAPAGPLYAALMTAGCTLEQFERLMDVLVKSGRLRKSGDLYFFVK